MAYYTRDDRHSPYPDRANPSLIDRDMVEVEGRLENMAQTVTVGACPSQQHIGAIKVPPILVSIKSARPVMELLTEFPAAIRITASGLHWTNTLSNSALLQKYFFSNTNYHLSIHWPRVPDCRLG